MFFEKERDGKNDKEGGYMREKKWEIAIKVAWSETETESPSTTAEMA